MEVFKPDEGFWVNKKKDNYHNWYLYASKIGALNLQPFTQNFFRKINYKYSQW